MRYSFVIYFIMVVLLASCEKTVEIDIPQRPPRLVINAWLKKGEVIEVMIGKSRNVLEPDNMSGNIDAYIVKNAIPVVYENNVAIDTLVYQPMTYKYISTKNRVVNQGFTYTIKVNAPGFAEAEASTAVPSQSEVAEILRFKEARTTSGGEKQDEIQIKLNDPAAENNFYLIQFFGAPYSTGPGYEVYCVSTTDKDIEAIGDNADPFSTDNCYDGGNLLMKDVNFNGKQKQLRFYIDSYELNEHMGPGGVMQKPYVKVLRITEDHFKFVKSYHVYYNSVDNPFAEPSNVFSNVKNGYGSFSAYTEYQSDL